MQRFFWQALFLSTCLLPGLCLGIQPAAYHASITREVKRLYSTYRHTTFCEYPFNDHYQIEADFSDLVPRSATKVAWMPVWPLERFSDACWQQGCSWKDKHRKGRLCCTLHSESFRAFSADLHNWLPVLKVTQ